MKRIQYRQCFLTRKLDGATQYQVCWLPLRYSAVGGTVDLRISGSDWSRNWNVVSTGTREVDESHLPDAHAGIRSHRRRTGDAQPRQRN